MREFCKALNRSFSRETAMAEKHSSLAVLLFVGVVGIAAILALLSSAILHAKSQDLTGAVVRGQIATLCRDTDDTTPTKKGFVSIFYGSIFPDQCYGDADAEETPKNTGTYLREYVCEKNEVSYQIYDCGTNKCQSGACISPRYTLLE